MDVATQQSEARVRAANAELARSEQIAARAAAATERAKAREAAAAERAAKQQTASQEREAAKRQQMIDRAVTREMNQTVRSIQQQERAAQQQTARLQREADRRVAAEAKAAERIKQSREKAEREADEHIAKMRQEIDSGAAASGIGKLVAFGAAVGVIKAVAQAFIDFNNNVIESSRLVTQYQEALRELAALRGHPGDTAKEMKEDLAFRSATLQTAAESRALREEALNVGQVSLDTTDASGKVISKGKMSAADFDEAMKYTGMMQAVFGGDAKVMGQMIGTVPQIAGKERMTGKEAFTYQSQLFDIFNLGGFGASEGAKQFSTIAPYIGPDLMGGQQAAALMSAYSNRDPARGATRVEQLVRATVGAQGRMRGARLEGVDTQKTGEYLKSIGADKLKDPVEIAQKISDDLAKQGYDPNKREEDMTDDERMSIFTYLGSKGYGGQEEKQAILGFHQMRDNLENKFLPMVQGRGGLKEGDPRKRAGKTFDEAMTPILAGQASSDVLQERSVGVLKDIADAAEGAGGAGTFDRLSRAAFERARAEGKWYAKGGKYEDLNSINPLNVGYNAALSGDVMQDLTRRGRAVGLQSYESFEPALALTASARGKSMQEYERMILERGGQKSINPEESLKNSDASLDLQRKQVDAAEQGLRIQRRRANEKPSLVGVKPPSGSNR